MIQITRTTINALTDGRRFHPGWTAMALLSALLCLSPVISAEEGESSGSIEIGAWDTSSEGSPDQVLEYEPEGGGPDLSLDWQLFADWGALTIDSRVRDDDDQSHEISFDVNRMLRSTTRYNGLLHRLGHDPLTNLEAATNHGRVVRHTDFDPDREYQIDYSRLQHRSELQPRRVSNLTVGLTYQRQERSGFKQALAISHCDACHVTSQSRPIDEATEDIGFDATIDWQGGQLRGSLQHRELRENVRAISLLYDDALQPELRIPVFDDRLQWDSAEGPQPVALKPDITKNIGKLALTFPDVSGFAVSLGGVWASTENEYSGLEADYRGFGVTAARAFDGGWRVRWRARAYSLDNDDVFVDTIERPGIAGPIRGRTYRDVYGFNPDFLRRSGLDREVVESRLDATYKISKKAGRLKLLWDFESIDRETFEVTPGDTQTTENILGISWAARPRKGLRLQTAWRHGEVDNPFGVVDGAFSTLVSPRVTSPFAANAAQYYEFQDARIADTTASPESWDELKVGLQHNVGKRSLSASYRFWDGDNDSGDLTDWSRQNQNATLSLWVAPKPEVRWNVAYTWSDTELDFPIFIPIFDG